MLLGIWATFLSRLSLRGAIPAPGLFRVLALHQFVRSVFRSIDRRPAPAVRFGRIGPLSWEIFHVATGQVAVVVASLVGVRLLTGYLSPSVYGEVAIAMTGVTLVNQLMFGPVGNAAARYYAPAAEADQIRSYLWASCILIGRKILLFAVLGMLAILILEACGYGRWMTLVSLAIALALLSGIGNVLDSMQNAARQRSVVAWHSGLTAWLKYGAALIAITLFGVSSSAAVGGYVVATWIVIGSQFGFFYRRIFRHTSANSYLARAESRPWLESMGSYALPFSIWGAFTWLHLSSDRWALGLFQTRADVGLYAVAYQLGYYPPLLVSGFSMQVVAPILYSKAGDGSDPGRIADAVRTSHALVIAAIVVTLLAALLGMFLHAEVFDLLVGAQYQAISYLLPIMILAGGLFGAGQLASLPLQIRADTMSMLAPKIGSALLGIAMTLIGAWYLGIEGVALSSVVFSTGYLTWVVVLANRRSVSRTMGQSPQRAS